MPVKKSALLVGLATYVPGIRALSGRKTGGTDSARYCYSVWLRHLCTLHRGGLRTTFETMVELGPGDSIGMGLAALLSGVGSYVALDAVPYINAKRNLSIFDELITLFRDRAPIPDAAEFPLVCPRLPSYAFPAEILTSARLNAALQPGRLDAIRAAIGNPATNAREGKPVCYVAPGDPRTIDSGTVDLVVSQTVLELPPDLPRLYFEMARWLKPGGLMSHEIDFKSIGLTSEWNGHWSCSDLVWRLIAGRRRHRLNREPHSTHIALMQKAGCRVVCDERTVKPSDITRQQLARKFRHLSDEDLSTSSALIQAMKPV